MNFCPNCEHCCYTNIDDGWMEYFYCYKHEEKEIDYCTIACEDFEQITG